MRSNRAMDMKVLALVCSAVVTWSFLSGVAADDPKPKIWPEQFHAVAFQNFSGALSVVDLWYDWPHGRNYNIIQKQLGKKTHDLEWTNGTSFYWDAEHETCLTIHFPVGILRPDWLAKAEYVGVQEIDGFKCNVWTKADFITYWEDIETRRPVAWLFFTGMFLHIMTFEEGAVLSDGNWQTPAYCFLNKQSEPLLKTSQGSSWERWLRAFTIGPQFLTSVKSALSVEN